MGINVADWDYKVGHDHSSLTIVPVLVGKEQTYTIKAPDDVDLSSACKFYTATNNMIDCIGNITAVKDNLCSAKVLYRGREVELHNIKMADGPKVIGERVMVSEHINVDGKFDLLATKKRILLKELANLNFINIGWESRDGECTYLRIDIFTGESKLISN